MEKYIGKILDGRYEILEIIGVGGMAVVYKAMDHRLNRQVAVKIMRQEMAADEEMLEAAKLRREPEDLCRALMALALSRGARDNVTVVAVK